MQDVVSLFQTNGHSELTNILNANQ